MAGDCYQVAGNLIISMRSSNALLCHGIATGQGRIGGIKHGHAWIEINDRVIDKSNNKDINMDKELYYRIGKIDGKKVKKYTRSKAIKKMIETEHYGSWD